MHYTKDPVVETRVASAWDSSKTSEYEWPPNDCEPSKLNSQELRIRAPDVCSCSLLAQRKRRQLPRASEVRRCSTSPSRKVLHNRRPRKVVFHLSITTGGSAYPNRCLRR